jgi:hypothetical protein
MPLTGYPDVNWFMRAARVLPAVAVAALVGGLIGGFSIYAIDSALTWQSRPDFRADNHAPEPQAMRPIRTVGGAIPDPSAGMSGPPPVQQQRASSSAPQQQAAAAQNSEQLLPALLTPQPLGPVSSLQPPTSAAKTSAQIPGATPVQTQAVQTQPVQTQSIQTQSANQAPAANAGPQQPTRWPDALSRARQGSPPAQQQTQTPQTQAPQPNAHPERAANNDGAVDRKANGDERAASANDDDRNGSSRRSRYSRRHANPTPNATTNASGSAATDDRDLYSEGARRRDARSYDRLYNSSDAARDQDQADQQTSRRYGRYSRDRSRSRPIVPDRQDVDRGLDKGQTDRGQGSREHADREQAREASPRRPEPFWGGGFFRRGDRFGGDDDD